MMDTSCRDHLGFLFAIASAVLSAAGCSRGGAGTSVEIDGGDLAMEDLSQVDQMGNDLVQNDLRPQPGFKDFKLVEAARIPSEVGIHALAVADLNKDGRPDVFVGGTTKRIVATHWNTGGFKFSAGPKVSISGWPAWLTTGDLDLDGNPDLVTAGFLTHLVETIKGDGSSVAYWRSVPVAMNSYPNYVLAQDLDGDGKTDLVTGDLGGGNQGITTQILYGTGGGAFASPVTQASGTGVASIAIGDLNNDGKLDLVTADYGGKAVTTIISRSARNFSVLKTHPASGQARILRLGDFNNDRNLDAIVSLDLTPGKLALFLGKGEGTFEAERTFVVGGSPYGIGVADLNQDGNLDAFSADYEGNSTSILLGKGDGTFAPAVIIPVCPIAMCVESADFDGDKKLDLAVACYNSAEVVILRNESL